MFISRNMISLPTRKKDAHKGDNGRLLIIGGSEEFVGAPALAAKAAYRSGVDIVEVIAPRKVAWAINTLDPCIITTKLPCSQFSKKHIPRIMQSVKKADAVLLGNGLGREKEKLLFVQELLKRIEKPLVIDADALHATNLKVLKTNQYVCTPHKKEFEILLKVSHCKEADFKKLLSEKKVILKKGPVDEIFAGKVILQNKTGCPQMAVAGTGDILAGFVAGLLAQKVSPLQSSITAAYLVGKAGEKVKKKYTNFSASKLLEVF